MGAGCPILCIAKGGKAGLSIGDTTTTTTNAQNEISTHCGRVAQDLKNGCPHLAEM
jgi:hypothetical protein